VQEAVIVQSNVLAGKSMVFRKSPFSKSSQFLQKAESIEGMLTIQGASGQLRRIVVGAAVRQTVTRHRHFIIVGNKS
jgi:hypothetical protein